MSSSLLSTQELWNDGRKMSITVKQSADPTTLLVSWTLPPLPRPAYNGAIVLLSETPFSSESIVLENGRKYLPSSNFAVPAETVPALGSARVIAAFYGYFNDNIAATSVLVSNTDPAKTYYASIHAASDVLQYYPQGVQSYLLDAPVDHSLSAYAGNIPSASAPPINPVNGQAYFDLSSGKVLAWSTPHGAWIGTSDKTVPIGERPPVILNQVFLNTSETKLKYFVGDVFGWLDCDDTNTQIKCGVGNTDDVWKPLGNVQIEPALPEKADSSDGDMVLLMGTPPIGVRQAPTQLKVFTLGKWLTFSKALLRIKPQGSSAYIGCEIGDKLFGANDPDVPEVGDFFYQSVLRDLLIWNGAAWTKVDTAEEGSATSDKVGMGTDGSHDERMKLIRVLKGQMGWPQVCVELSEEQFDIAIDNAIETFRMRADNAYAQRYITFTLTAGQQTYYLNDPRVKTDRIVNIMRIGRVNSLGASQMNDPIYGQLMIPQVFQTGHVDLVSIHLMHQLSETFEKIFAANLLYTWDEASRVLNILRNIPRNEHVVLECTIERTEQELLLDRWCKQWLQGWAVAEIKETLGLIRSKFSSVPGPNGGLTLNGDLLMSEARMDFEDLSRQILDYEVGNSGVAFFIG